MFRKIIFFLFYSPLALAQLTTVTGTVKDPSGLPYSLGTISATLIISGSPRFASGFPYTPPSAPVGLDTNGHFTMSLADVTQILPAGGTWSFHVCSATGTVQPGSPITAGPVCFDTTGLIISGSSQDISTPLSTAAKPLTSGLGGGGSGTVAPGIATHFAFYPAAGTTVTPNPTLLDNSINIVSAEPVTAPSFILPVNGNGVLTGVGGNPSPIAGQGSFGVLTGGIPAISANGSVFRVLQTPSSVNGTAFTGSSFTTFTGTAPNSCTPAAPANGRCVVFSAGGPNTGQVSGAIVGDGIVTDCFLGNGNFGPCFTNPTTSTGTALTALTAGTGGFGFNTGGIPSISAGGNWFPAAYITVNGAATPRTINAVNFANAAPVGGANAINVTWNSTGTGSANVSASIVGDGISTDCFLGTGTFGPCNPSGQVRGTVCSGTSGTCTATFTPAALAPPLCTATATTTGVTSFFISATTTSTVTVSYSPSTPESFQLICLGN